MAGKSRWRGWIERGWAKIVDGGGVDKMEESREGEESERREDRWNGVG